MQKKLVALLVLPFLCSCSMNNTGPGDSQPPDWDVLGPKIQSRVKLVAAFAFSLEQVKPYKVQVCSTTDQIVELLNSYDDQSASFETVRAAVMEVVGQIADENVRNAVMIFVDVILTESFNYAWQYYGAWIELNEVKTVIIIARSVGNGIKDACDLIMSASTMSDGTHKQFAFTAPRD